MDGFLGTRADFTVDLVMTISGFLPFLLLSAFYIASKRKFDLHKNLQIILFIIVTILVISLEFDVRYGDLKEISKRSPYAGSIELMVVFLVHLFFAVSSFFAWCWLIVKSLRRYPTFFDFEHKKYGKIIFWDIILMVISGWVLYWMTFAA
jgi:membrane-associated HD superfamily phosphohydrolase